MTRTLQTALIGLILIAGCLLRFWDLGWHFAHIDDIGVAKNILDARHAGLSPFWSVPDTWTYAPFQFWITALLLNLEQSYREILFWGRLPSAGFSAAALFVFAAVYLRSSNQPRERVLLPLALLACSWENIIFAKQMNNYALGALAMTVLLGLLFYLHAKDDWTLKEGCFGGIVTGALVWWHYQALFLLPAFWAALLLVRRRPVVAYRALIPAFLFQAVLILPLLFYLKDRTGTGGLSGWNQGAVNEFVFALKTGASFFENIVYAAGFFFGNAARILRSLLAFGPEAWFPAVSGVVFLALFITGCAVSLRSADDKRRLLSLFTLCAAGLWIILVVLQKLTFSPTRHALIYAPLFVWMISEGIYFVMDRVLKREILRVWIPAVLSMLIVTSCFSSFNRFLEERRDPFIESEISGALEKYPVDALLRVNFTSQVSLMKSVRDLLGVYDENTDIHAITPRQPNSLDRIAWVSHRDPLTRENFEAIRFKGNLILGHLNNQRARSGQPPLPLLKPYESYETVLRQVSESDREIEYSRETRNGANNLYFYILYSKR